MRSSILSGTALALAGAALLAWGCGSSSSPSSPSSPSTPGSSAQSVTVTINSATGAGSFNPNPVPANPGDTVAFKNNDTNTHHIVMDDGSADLGDVAPGQTSKTATVKAGGGAFHCTLHPWMVGAVNQPVPDQPPCTGGPAYCD
jgi:plastocyanin